MGKDYEWAVGHYRHRYLDCMGRRDGGGCTLAFSLVPSIPVLEPLSLHAFPEVHSGFSMRMYIELATPF